MNRSRATSHRRDPHPAVAAAPLPVPAGRPGRRVRGAQAHRRAQERHHQRTVLPGPFPRPSGDAGRAGDRGAGPGRRRADPALARHGAPSNKLFYLVKIDNARFSTHGRAGRSCWNCTWSSSASSATWPCIPAWPASTGELVAWPTCSAPRPRRNERMSGSARDPSQRRGSTRRRAWARMSAVGAVRQHRRGRRDRRRHRDRRALQRHRARPGSAATTTSSAMPRSAAIRRTRSSAANAPNW